VESASIYFDVWQNKVSNAMDGFFKIADNDYWFKIPTSKNPYIFHGRVLMKYIMYL